MTPLSVVPASTDLAVQLANSAARALALAGIAGLGLAAFRVKATSARLFTWTAVLYAALAMPLLGRMLPPLQVPVPAFLRNQAAQLSVREDAQPFSAQLASAAGRTFSARGYAAKTRSVNAAPVSLPASARRIAPPRSPWTGIPWTTVAAAIYVAVAVFLLVRFFIGIAFSRRLLRASRQIIHPRVRARVASRVRASAAARIPWIAESEFISVPVTMGALWSTILLPSSWREWDDAKLDAVIAHEVSHVARRDALTQRLSLLHRAIFWFSPLAWFLDRHLADLAEQASDEAALSGGADRQDYARTLLGFFEALHAAPGRVWWQGVSMAKLGQAEQRVERILTWKGSVAMRLKKSMMVVVVAFAVPVVYLAAAAHPARIVGGLQDVGVVQSQRQEPPPTPQAAPAPAPAPSPTAISMAPPPAPTPVPSVRPIAAPRPLAAVAPIASIAPVARSYRFGQATGSGSSKGKSFFRYGYDDDQRFIIVTGKTDSLTMSGSMDDAHHVEKLRKQIAGDFIWFQRDEKSYIIRDQATIDRAEAFWAPQEELGKRQEELGKQQEALGAQQEELGAKMEKIQVKVPDMTAELDNLKAELKQLSSSGATMEQMGHVQEEMGELQEKIGNLQSHAGDQQGKLGEEMGALGEKQGKLGEEQGKLGEEQGKLAEQANRQMKQLLDDAISKGTAQPEP